MSKAPKGQPLYSVIVTKRVVNEVQHTATHFTLRSATSEFMRLCDEYNYDCYYANDEEIIMFTYGMDNDFRIELIVQYVISVLNPAMPPRQSKHIL